MLLEVLKNYMEAVNGATRLTQRSATSMARNMLLQAGMEPAADLVHQLSEQLIAAQDAQYAMIRQMIRSEASTTTESMDLASETTGPDSSERTPAEAPSAPAAPAEDIAEPTAGATAPAKKTPAEKAQPRKTPAKTASTSKAAPASKKAIASKAAPASKKATAKKVTKKAPTRPTASRPAAKKAAASEATDDNTSS